MPSNKLYSYVISNGEIVTAFSPRSKTGWGYQLPFIHHCAGDPRQCYKTKREIKGIKFKTKSKMIFIYILYECEDRNPKSYQLLESKSSLDIRSMYKKIIILYTNKKQSEN